MHNTYPRIDPEPVEPAVFRRALAQRLGAGLLAIAALSSCSTEMAGDDGKYDWPDGVVVEGQHYGEKGTQEGTNDEEAISPEILKKAEDLNHIYNLAMADGGIVPTVFEQLPNKGLDYRSPKNWGWEDRTGNTKAGAAFEAGHLTVWKQARVKGKDISVKVYGHIPEKTAFRKSIDTPNELREWAEDDEKPLHFAVDSITWQTGDKDADGIVIRTNSDGTPPNIGYDTVTSSISNAESAWGSIKGK